MDGTRVLLSAGAVAAAVLAAVLGSGPGAIGLALLAVVLATWVAATSLAGRSVRREWVLDVPEADSLVLLRESFRGGRLGRQAIVSTVARLERAASGERLVLSSAEEERLRALSRAEFREWLTQRLAVLEAET